MAGLESVDMLELVRAVGEAAACDSMGCVELRKGCAEYMERYPYDCRKEKAEIVRYGLVSGETVERLLEKARQVYEAGKQAEETAVQFRKGEASLSEALAAWTRYRRLKEELERETRKAKRLIDKALHGEDLEEQRETPQDRLYNAVKEVVEREAITSCSQCDP